MELKQGFKPSNQQVFLGMRVTSIVKKCLREKRQPTHKELLEMAKIVNPSVTDGRQASTALMNEGVNTLIDAGAFEDKSKVENLVKGIVGEAENATDLQGFLNRVGETVIANSELDPGIKMLAAAMLGEC